MMASISIPLRQPGPRSAAPVLDLWHWRGARSNPIGRADDQNILALTFVDSSSGDDGGRKGDAGTSVFTSQGMDPVTGPDFLMDPGTTSGKFAFTWDNFWTTPFYYMTQDNAQQEGPRAPNPGIIAYTDAVAMGYAPTEGDTVPRRILRAGAGSRADVTSNRHNVHAGDTGQLVRYLECTDAARDEYGERGRYCHGRW